MSKTKKSSLFQETQSLVSDQIIGQLNSTIACLQDHDMMETDDSDADREDSDMEIQKVGWISNTNISLYHSFIYLFQIYVLKNTKLKTGCQTLHCDGKGSTRNGYKTHTVTKYCPLANVLKKELKKTKNMLNESIEFAEMMKEENNQLKEKFKSQSLVHSNDTQKKRELEAEQVG